jgi:hypothetical protein
MCIGPPLALGTAAEVPSPMKLCPNLASLHSRFLSLLPRIELHGRVAFRGVRCKDRLEDCIAEMVALAWKWFLSLVERGKDPLEFPTAIATFAARQVRSGRRLCGQEKDKDVLSHRAQQRRNFNVEPLPASTRRAFDDVYGSAHGQRDLDAFEERLRDNTRTPPDEQAAFRLDFPAWLYRRSERDRRVIDDLMRGERTLDVANRHGLSPARVSQLRREFMEDWQHFCGDDGRLPTAAKV